jgi:hypothetical protein
MQLREVIMTDVATLAEQLMDPDVLGNRGWDRTKEHQDIYGKVFLYSHFVVRVHGKTQDLVLMPSRNRNAFKVRPREFTGEEWLYWEQSEYASLDPKTALRTLRPQVEYIQFNLSKSYTLPAEFLHHSRQFNSFEDLATYFLAPVPKQSDAGIGVKTSED